MLSEQELSYFKTFGVVTMKNVFTPKELATIQSEFDHQAQVVSGYKPFDGTQRHWFLMMDQDTPFFVSMFEEDRLAGTAEQLFGPRVMGMGCDANRYVGDTSWHPDSNTLHHAGVKFAFYLQPVRADSGALRVIPGSHRDPLHNTLWDLKQAGALDKINEVPACACEADPGDVIAFDLRVWHASWGGPTDRHMCVAVFYKYPQTREQTAATGFQLNQHLIRDNSKTPWIPDGFYPQSWLANASGSSRRQRWIDDMSTVRRAKVGLEVVNEGGKAKFVESPIPGA